MNNNNAYLLLNGLPKVGPISARELLNSFDGNAADIFRANKTDLMLIKGIGGGIVESLKNPKNEDWLDAELEKIKKRGAKFLIQPELPELLLEIYDPPIGMYVAGKIPKLPFIGIVGTRNPTMYGQKQARLFAGQLTQAGFCVVSGMARGIDSAAHEGALDAGGPTVAVLGSGLDIVYPPENLNLYQRIMENGAVVSEFPFGRKADRRTFPMRNRLVSGVSQAVLVVESASSGGSLITAQSAADQGRTVFAIPGRIDQPSSNGCHKIIRDGATLVMSVNDILEDMRPYMEQKQISFNFPCDDEVEGDSKNLSNQLSSKENLLVSQLKEGDQLSLDELSVRCSFPVYETMSLLTLLELNKYVKKNQNGKFELL